MLSKYDECVGFIDREWERFHGSKIPVYSLEEISGLDFDYLVIAIKIVTRTKVIWEELILHGVNLDRIIYMGHRAETKLPMLQGGKVKNLIES